MLFAQGNRPCAVDKDVDLIGHTGRCKVVFVGDGVCSGREVTGYSSQIGGHRQADLAVTSLEVEIRRRLQRGDGERHWLAIYL